MSVEPFVRQNVDAFLDLFKRIRKQSSRSTVRFRTWIDCETGQLCFAEEDKLPPMLKDKQWKQLDLTCFYDEEAGQIRLEEQEPSAIDLAPMALRIFQESVRALKQLEGSTSCVVKLSDQLLISKIWHHVDRYEAEALLFQHAIGTYLCRKDLFAELLENQLSRQMPQKISLWTITVVLPERKCSDYTLVHVNGSWQIYNDDVSLTQKTFSELAQLIESLKGICRYPLYNL
jgi:hypothetical protein